MHESECRTWASLEYHTCAASGASSDRTFLGPASVSGPYPLQPIQPSEALLWWWCSTIWDGRRQGNWKLGWGWDRVKLWFKTIKQRGSWSDASPKDILNGSSVHLFSCAYAVCRWIKPRCLGPGHAILLNMMINPWILVSLILRQTHPVFEEHAWNFLQRLDLPIPDARIAFLPCNFPVRWWIWRPEPCNHCVWRRWWLHSKLSFCARSAAWTGKRNKKTSEDEDGSSIEHGSLLGGFDCFYLLIYLFIYLSIYLFIYSFIYYFYHWTWMLWLLNLSVILLDQLKLPSKASLDDQLYNPRCWTTCCIRCTWNVGFRFHQHVPKFVDFPYLCVWFGGGRGDFASKPML